MSEYYAHGATRRLAEQKYNQPPQYELSEYDTLPGGEEVVEDMVENGFDEATARESVQALGIDPFFNAQEESD